jgi:hypothetical protein
MTKQRKSFPVAPLAMQRVVATDRKFFERNPQRRFYAREMFEVERAQDARASGSYLLFDPTIVDLVIVNQVFPGCRIRTGGPLMAREHFEALGDVIRDDEQLCEKLFFTHCSEELLKQRQLLLRRHV